MNKPALKYRLYQTLLETDLSSEQKTALVEAGFLQKVADFFGAGKDVLTKDLKALFANNKLARRAATAKKNISKEIDELKAIAKDAGVSDEAVYDMLNLTLKSKDVSPQEVASMPKPDNTGGGSKTQTGISPGKPVDIKSPEAVPTLAKAAGEAAGQDPQKAADQAEEKKVDAPKATEVLAKAISNSSKVDAGKVAKILGFLIKNNHMIAEGRRVMSTDIKKAIIEVEKRNRENSLLERWNSMSGLSLINEEVDEVKKKKFEDVLDDVRKAFKAEEMSDDEILNVIIALDDLNSIQIK
jgi:hypothetical protein